MTKPKGFMPPDDAEKYEIARRYIAGEGLEILCKEFKRAKPTLKKIIIDAGGTIRPRGNPKGTVWSPERREAHKKATNTPEFKERSRKSLLKRLPSMRGPAVNTPIERRLHDVLKNAGIGFTTQAPLLERYLVDILINQKKVIIEADGAQHTLRAQKAKDRERDAALKRAGYQVFRFTGSEINRDAPACIDRVVMECRLSPDEKPVYNIRTKFSGEQHPLWKGGKREYTCDYCGKTFLAQPSHRRSDKKFCSSSCANKSRTGKPISEEHRKKISDSMRKRRY